ncbi:dimethyl sulfoxide reductase anchor subunit [Salmonella enterica]
MPREKQQTGVSRRTLVKSAALGSLALAAGGVSLPFGMRTAAAVVQQAMRNEEDKIVWGACSVNCGSRCALRLHVKDNEVWWVETDNTGDDVYGNHQVRACLRGRSIRRRINHPDRLNYPMKRVGRRSEGKFERISWQEALDTISASLKKIVETYGNEAVYIHYSSGIVGGNITRSSPAASPVKRLMNCYGGSLNQYGSYSTAQISCAMPYTYGSNDGNSTSDIENSKLVVMFGNNPAETRMSGGGITWFLEQARERSNARMIVIMHLGSPMRAFNSLNRVGASALSNEIAAGSVFFAVGGIWWLVAVLGKMPPALGKVWLLVSMALGVAFIWAMTLVYQIDTVPTWYNGYTTLAFFLTAFLCGPVFAALLLRIARVPFCSVTFASISGLALVVCVAVIVLQGLSLSAIHSSVQQASHLAPDYGMLQVWRIVLLAAGLGCWLCPLIRRREPHTVGLLLGVVLVLAGEIIGRGLFYGLHMTVGMAVAG